jgi:hypothetical protein
MAEGIVYLDVDDEITSAAQRIRSATGTKVALVVPYGSRIATSRMNFRLLSREALVSNKRLSIISGDAGSRSLAASAGLPVFGSVAEYESSLSVPRAVDPADAAASDATAAVVVPPVTSALAASETLVTPAAESETAADAVSGRGRKSQRPKRPVSDETTTLPVIAPVAPAVGGAAGRAAFEGRPEPTNEPDASLPPLLGGRIKAPVVAALGLLALALVVAGVAGYLFLPSATVAIEPRRDIVGPILITVSADPEATAVDPVNGVVPADRIDVPVEATRTFTTAGTHVEESSARGSVTFTNYDTSSGVSIPTGSLVSTEGGTRFRTQRTVVLQPAGIIPFAPTSGAVQVVAVKTGEGGNVPANTIRVVPQGQNPDLLKVNNPGETNGGTHTETPEIKPGEVDKALAALQKDLQATFDEAIASGAHAPEGTTLFPETALLGPATPNIDTATLVGKADPTFDLTLTAQGTVIAVDPSPVQSIAESQLASKVKANHRLVAGSVDIDVGEGTVGEDGQVTFQATARATEVAIVDAAAIPGLIKGKTSVEAKAALVEYGDATVTLWPDWVSTVTSMDARLTVTIDQGPGAGDGSASPSPSRASPRPSRTPGASGSAPPSGSAAAPSSAAP